MMLDLELGTLLASMRMSQPAREVVNVLASKLDDLDHEVKLLRAQILRLTANNDSLVKERNAALDELSQVPMALRGAMNLMIEVILSPSLMKSHKINCIKIVRAATYLGLKEAKELVEDGIAAEKSIVVTGSRPALLDAIFSCSNSPSPLSPSPLRSISIAPAPVGATASALLCSRESD